MPPLLISILSLFANPIGALINKAIGMGAAAVLAYSTAHGNPLGDLHNVVAEAAVGISTLISTLAASQGVTIPVINSSQNGVIVVPTAQAQTAGVARVNAPLK